MNELTSLIPTPLTTPMSGGLPFAGMDVSVLLLAVIAAGLFVGTLLFARSMAGVIVFMGVLTVAGVGLTVTSVHVPDVGVAQAAVLESPLTGHGLPSKDLLCVPTMSDDCF